MKTVGEIEHAIIDLSRVRRIAYPGHHGLGSIGQRIAFLNHQAIKGIGIIAGPALVEARQRAQVNPTPTTRTRLPEHRRVPGAQSLNDLVECLNMAHIDLALPLQRSIRPAWFSNGAIEIPLDKHNSMFAQQAIQAVKDVRGNFWTGEIQEKLVAQLGSFSLREVIDPVRMSAIEVAVGINHFWLYPDTKFHPQAMDLVNQGAQTVGELLWIYPPVAKTGTVVVPFAKPAIINYKEFNAKLSRPLGQSQLFLFVDIKIDGFPAIVENRAKRVSRCGRQEIIQLVAVQIAARLPKALAGIASDKRRSAKL